MANPKEALASLHPIFRVPQTRVFWHDAVTHFGRHGKQSSRNLVVCTPGLLLLKKRAVGKSFTLDQTISFHDLLLVRLDGNKMDFHGPKLTMLLQSPKSTQVVGIVWQLSTLLFGDRSRLTKFVIDADVRREIEKSCRLSSNCLFSDRFLSAVLSVPPSQVEPEQVGRLCDLLQEVRSSFTLDSTAVAQGLLEPICNALSCQRSILSLEIRNSNFSSILGPLLPVLQYNSVIKNLTFQSCTFNGSLKKYIDVWSAKTEFAVSDWIFNDCNLASADFELFLQAFDHYPADIARISFSKCKLGAATVNLICERLVAAHCFRTLTELSFEKLPPAETKKLVSHLFSSNFFQEQHNITCLVLCDCGAEVNQVLPLFCQADTNIDALSLNENSFVSPSGLEAITGFRRITELSLSGVTCTGASLLALFRAMACASPAPSRLILDGLKLTDANNFWNAIVGIKVDSLDVLSFANNEITDGQFAELIAFLRWQPHLSSLALGGTARSEIAVAQLCSLIQDTNLHALDLECTSGKPLGQLLIPLLDAILERGTIQKLNITGQAVSDAGLERLATMSETCLIDLRCDGSVPGSYEVFLATTSRMAVSRLLACSWPYKDVALISAKLPAERKGPLINKFEVLRATFENRLDPTLESKARQGIYPDMLGRSSSTVELEPGKARRISAWGEAFRPLAENKMLSYRDTFVRDGLATIFGATPITEPLLVAIEGIEGRTSLKALAA
jgi:hypothetical protein